MLVDFKFTRLMCRISAICAGFLLCLVNLSNGQDFFFPGNQTKQSLTFKFIKNLIIIPIYINGKGPYDFVLDTGVGPMIVTDPSIIDSLDFSRMRKITVSGLGVETVEAYVSQNITATVGRAIANHIPTAVLKNDVFNLSGHLGIKIYGLIGFNFFNSFVVDIRYSNSRIVFSSPERKIKYRGRKVPITIDNLKPYVLVEAELANRQRILLRLLMDTGASHAVSMEALKEEMFPLPEPKIKANLGMSLSGQIKGYVGRIKNLDLGGYNFKNVVAGFPDYKAISKKIDLKNRNGNLGADLLRKFNIQFDYKGGFIYIKPNGAFKTPFEYDMVGMVVYLDPVEFKRLVIGEIDENSPAERSGLCVDDEILSVNFRSVGAYSLNELSELFRSGASKSVILEIYRDNKIFYKVVHMERRI